MMKKSLIFILVCAILIVVAGLSVLIWWLVAGRHSFSVLILENEGLGELQNTAAFTTLRRTGNMFWWFYPTISNEPTTKPIILWLDGVTGVPPSLLANFGMFGPYDFNMNRRNFSWIENYNLLFIDAPLGTGFSTAQTADAIATNLDQCTDHLLPTVESFYSIHREFRTAPLYIFGQGHGAALAVSLAIRLAEVSRFSHNLKGVVIGNGIISPGLVLTKLGYYLEELAYIDGNGRFAIETRTNRIKDLVDNELFEQAYIYFLNLEEYINENAGAIAVNLGHIVEKLQNDSVRDYFGQKHYLQDVFGSDRDVYEFMKNTVAARLGINDEYDIDRKSAIDALKRTFMIPVTDKVEYLLEHTTISVAIYNGNLDAVTNTPGQLEWVDNLEWYGQEEFNSSLRSTLIVNGQIEGYFKRTKRLSFYWMNVAGQFVPLDSPVAMRRILELITEN